jgi:mRNA interferase RelE/StbE
MKWGLVIANRAKRNHRRLPMEDREQIDRALSQMMHDPLAGDVKFLRGSHGMLRRRIGDWRILFELDREKRIILITDVTRRGSNTY